MEGVALDQLKSPYANRLFDYDFGPRGVCGVQDGIVRCVGAVASPEASLPLSHVRVSPGQDASACAIGNDHRLYCWGEAYASSGHRNSPVAIAVVPVPVPTNSDRAAIDYARHWGSSCAIHRPCYAKQKLQRCPDSLLREAAAWPRVFREANRLAGTKVTVRGDLGFNGFLRTLAWCGNDCCNIAVTRMSLDGSLSLMGFACRVDESRMCCDLEVDRTVIATGVLTPPEENEFDPKWSLASPQLCFAGR